MTQQPVLVDEVFRLSEVLTQLVPWDVPLTIQLNQKTGFHVSGIDPEVLVSKSAAAWVLRTATLDDEWFRLAFLDGLKTGRTIPKDEMLSRAACALAKGQAEYNPPGRRRASTSVVEEG